MWAYKSKGSPTNVSKVGWIKVGVPFTATRKGETATRYYTKCYGKTLVTLKEVEKTYKNGQVILQKDTGRTQTVYAYKAVEPNFKFTYSK